MFKGNKLLSILLVMIVFLSPMLVLAEGNKPYKEVEIAHAMTYLYDNSAGRVTNIKLAASSIDYLFIRNGEEFSFNQIVGQRTKARGYKVAKFIDGQGYGGGICQLSTTLNMAVKQTNIQILERSLHSKRVPYVKDRNLEAMINWGTNDYRFKNVTGDTIRIEAYVIGRHVNIRIFQIIPK